MNTKSWPFVSNKLIRWLDLKYDIVIDLMIEVDATWAVDALDLNCISANGDMNFSYVEASFCNN